MAEGTVVFKVDQRRLTATVTVDEVIGLQEGNLRQIRDVLSQFVWVDGGYLPKGEGLKIVGKLTIDQLLASAATFMGEVDTTMVPPENGADSS